MQIDFIEQLKKLDARIKTALISSLLIGLFSQGMGLFNKFSIHDDVMNYGIGTTYTLGRWMLDILGVIEEHIYGDGHYSLPTFNGLIGIAFIAFSACLLIYILDIKNLFSCLFISGIMVCFPVVTSYMGYMFTFHLYAISLFLGMLGVFLITKYEKRSLDILGIVCLAASVGIYQAFLPVILTLLLMCLMSYAVQVESAKSQLFRILKYVIICGLFMGFYFVATKAYLVLKNASLSDYKGINSMGQKSLIEYMGRAVAAYKEFFVPDKTENYYMYPGNILFCYWLVIIFSIILILRMAIGLAKQDKFSAVIFILLTCCFPLCSNFIFVMTGKDQVHSLMVYGQLMPFVLFIWLLENISFNEEFAKKISVVSALLLSLILVMYCRVDNKCYLKANLCQQEAISYFTTLVTQIKETDGYKDEYPVVFINGTQNTDTSLKLADNGNLSDIVYSPYGMDTNGYVNDVSWFIFMEQWTGFSPETEDAEAFENLQEVKDMPSYPDDGSIKIINDVVVVKF